MPKAHIAEQGALAIPGKIEAQIEERRRLVGEAAHGGVTDDF